MGHSESQMAVFKAVTETRDNIAVQAAPGAGKTYTLLEVLKLLPRLKKTIFLSFSNAIVNELKAKVPKHVRACTLHSLGNGFIRARFPGIDIDDKKYFKLALEQFEKKDKEVFKKCFTIQDICNYARLTLSPFDEDSLIKLCDQYGVDSTPECIVISSIILAENTKLKRIINIDFADMIYFPAVYPEMVNEFFDYVCVDEVQDTNNAQAQLIENIVRKQGGRVIIVGDEKQAIYGFQGSNIDSFQRMVEKFNCRMMALTVTRRCAKAVVRLAQTVYPDVIEAWEESPEGEERRGELREAKPGDMVICRNTRPLISAFFDFISRDKKAYIVGKDLEKGLVAIAESVSAQSKEYVKKNIERRLDTFVQELRDDGISEPEKNPKYVALLEKCDILLLILEKIEYASQLTDKIRQIFHEDVKAVKLLTAHRSKGLESERVFFIETFNQEKLLPSKYAVLDWQKVQETNLLFVTYTRAKREFVFCDLVE